MVHIIDDWYFSTEGTTYALIRRFKTSKGVEINRPQGYYACLEHLLDRLSQILAADEVDKGVITEISDYISALRAISENLKTITKGC